MVEKTKNEGNQSSLTTSHHSDKDGVGRVLPMHADEDKVKAKQRRQDEGSFDGTPAKERREVQRSSLFES